MIRKLGAQHQLLKEYLVQQMSALLHPQRASNASTPEMIGDNPSEGLPIWLMKMGYGDDPKAFLVICEWMATMAHWPLEHWPTLMVPYLTSPAQAAYQNLFPAGVLDYAKVKAAILNHLGITPETFGQRFHQETYTPGA